jgi:hypothetical protein
MINCLPDEEVAMMTPIESSKWPDDRQRKAGLSTEETLVRESNSTFKQSALLQIELQPSVAEAN